MKILLVVASRDPGTYRRDIVRFRWHPMAVGCLKTADRGIAVCTTAMTLDDSRASARLRHAPCQQLATLALPKISTSTCSDDIDISITVAERPRQLQFRPGQTLANWGEVE